MAKISVVVESRSGKEMGRFTLEKDAKVIDLKHIFTQSHPRYYPERQWFTIDTARGEPLKDDQKRISEYSSGELHLVFKDLGACRLSWRLVYIIEYLGPLLIFPLLYYYPAVVYGEYTDVKKTATQQLCFFMLMFHFAKREMETISVHRFSSATMPMIRLPLNCGYYWVLNGVLIGYFLFHPLYTDPSFSSTTRNVCCGLFLGFEAMNGWTHLILRDLRPAGTKTRGIPMGAGFGLVSCANYWWEICAWTTFAVLSHCLTSYLFLLASWVTLVNWSKDRHRRYLKEFDGKEGRPLYPHSRTALVPFLI